MHIEIRQQSMISITAYYILVRKRACFGVSMCICGWKNDVLHNAWSRADLKGRKIGGLVSFVVTKKRAQCAGPTGFDGQKALCCTV